MSPTLTLPELAERLDIDETLLGHVLLDSERLGLVAQDASGRWGLTPQAERRYGAALRAIGAAASGNGDGGRGIGYGRLGRKKGDKRRQVLRARDGRGAAPRQRQTFLVHVARVPERAAPGDDDR